MATKKGGFLNRLELESAAKGPDVVPRGETPARTKKVGASSSSARPGRAGKVNVTGYFHPDVKRSLMMIRLKPEKTGQESRFTGRGFERSICKV